VDVVLWNVMPCAVVISRSFGGSYCFHFQGGGSKVCISTPAFGWRSARIRRTVRCIFINKATRPSPNYNQSVQHSCNHVIDSSFWRTVESNADSAWQDHSFLFTNLDERCVSIAV